MYATLLLQIQYSNGAYGCGERGFRQFFAKSDGEHQCFPSSIRVRCDKKRRKLWLWPTRAVSPGNKVSESLRPQFRFEWLILPCPILYGIGVHLPWRLHHSSDDTPPAEMAIDPMSMETLIARRQDPVADKFQILFAIQSGSLTNLAD
jgi:hypothetical protein